MWRRTSSNLHPLSRFRSLHRSFASSFPATASSSSSPSRLRRAPILDRCFSSDAGSDVTKKKVEELYPIATGHERQELEAELEGRDLLEINHPVGPFGTKEAPAIVKSAYDRRVVGCPGGEGEDEHDVVWFWLEKDKPHECPVCSQYFKLEVVGKGGDPDLGHHH